MDSFIKWAQQEYADFLEDGNTVFAEYFRDRLLPTLISSTGPCAHPGCQSHTTHPCEGCGVQWPKH